MTHSLTLELLPHIYTVCQLAPDAPPPEWARGEFLSVTRTSHEVSVVCRQENVPAGIRCERDWRVLRVNGPLDFSLTGILSSISTALANSGVPIFAISTFDTDYIMVKQKMLTKAIDVLTAAGHVVHTRVSPAP